MKKLKLKIMLKFLQTSLAELLEKFKARNPQMWFLVFLAIITLQIGLEPALTVMGLNVAIGLPPEFLSLDWLIAKFGWNVSDTLTDFILTTLASLTGSKTLLYLKPEKRKEKLEDLNIENKARVASGK